MLIRCIFEYLKKKKVLTIHKKLEILTNLENRIKNWEICKKYNVQSLGWIPIRYIRQSTFNSTILFLKSRKMYRYILFYGVDGKYFSNTISLLLKL